MKTYSALFSAIKGIADSIPHYCDDIIKIDLDKIEDLQNIASEMLIKSGKDCVKCGYCGQAHFCDESIMKIPK